jgi:hypothetical protein
MALVSRKGNQWRSDERMIDDPDHSNTFDGRGGNKHLPIDEQRPFTDFETLLIAM